MERSDKKSSKFNELQFILCFEQIIILTYTKDFFIGFMGAHIKLYSNKLEFNKFFN